MKQLCACHSDVRYLDFVYTINLNFTPHSHSFMLISALHLNRNKFVNQFNIFIVSIRLYNLADLYYG